MGACAGKKGDASLDSFYPVLRHHPQMQQVETYAQACRTTSSCTRPCAACYYLLLGRLSIVLSCCNVLLSLLIVSLALDCSACDDWAVTVLRQIRAAHMCEAPYTGALNAQTRYTLDDGTRVVLDYPVKTYVARSASCHAMPVFFWPVAC